MAFYEGLIALVTRDQAFAVRLAPGCVVEGRLDACFEV